MAATPGVETRMLRAAQARAARRPRVVAALLDGIAFAVIAFVVNGVYGVTQITSGSLPSAQGEFGYFTTTTAVGWPWLTLVWVLYHAIPEVALGASLGKLALGLRVVRADGRRLSVGAVVMRNLLRPIDLLPAFYLLGGASVLITRAGRRLGDLAAGTTVVQRRWASEPGATRAPTGSTRLALLAVVIGAAIFTAAFDYFGRPPLVIEGLYNQQQLLSPQEVVTGYSLGQPRWSFGSVTYPVTLTTPKSTCKGSIQLVWSEIGWTEGGANFACASGL